MFLRFNNNTQEIHIFSLLLIEHIQNVIIHLTCKKLQHPPHQLKLLKDPYSDQKPPNNIFKTVKQNNENHFKFEKQNKQTNLF